MLSYYLGCAGTWALCFLLSPLVFRQKYAMAIVAGMTGGLANTAIRGIPVILTAYGEAGAVPLFIIISLHSTILFRAAIILVEGGRGDSGKLLSIPTNIVRGLAKKPIIIALILGYVANGLNPSVPSSIDQIADMLATVALPCAVFSTDASLTAYRLESAILPAITWTFLKLVIHPALVWLLASYVLRS